MVGADYLLQSFNLLLLLFDGVDQGGADAVVLHAFDLALRIVGDQERLDCRHFLRAEAEVVHTARLPVESD